MKILILEDNAEKSLEIENLIKSIDQSINIQKVEYYNNFILKIQKEKFDLVIIDLFVPALKGREPNDLSEDLLFSLRNEECTNFQTEVVAITKYDEKASEIIQDYNYQNITVLTFSEDDKWKESLIKKITPLNSDQCDFIIICALEKEANAFAEAGFDVSESVSKYSLNFRSISISDFKGAIIRLPRPGLVDAAIVTSRAIEILNPKIVTMSGICAGLKNEISIYDLIIPNLCFQHDTGKWTEDGLISEPYSVSINNKVEVEISTELDKPNFTIDLMNIELTHYLNSTKHDSPS
jgi:CheY-like chemotaxis protein